MHHTFAFSASIADSVLTDIAAINDDIIPITNGHLFPQQDRVIPWLVGYGTNLLRFQITTPYYRRINTPWVRPVTPALVSTSNQAIADLRRTPMKAKGLEELSFSVFQNAGAAQRITIVGALQWDEQPAPSGDLFTLRGTSTTAAVANAWTTITMTWETALPAGVYAVVWVDHISTNSQACRLSIENQVPRPGFTGLPSEASRQPQTFIPGGLGNWGQFRNTAMPAIQVLANAADNAHTIYMYLVRVAELPY